MLLVAVARIAFERGIEYLWAWPSPCGNENDVHGRLKFFESCSMEILNEGADHVVVVGRAADVATCGSEGAFERRNCRSLRIDLTDSYAPAALS